MTTAQGDLFAPEDQGPPPGHEDKMPHGHVHPNPFDGLVHALKEVSTDRGARTITVKCGAPMPTYRTHETLAGATGFNSRVTCPACRWTPP